MSRLSDIEARVNKLREALNDVEKHLATIAESPYAMGEKDIEQLALAREVIEAALAEVE